MIKKKLESSLKHLLGTSISIENTEQGLWLRYDTDDSDPKEQWDNYIEVVEALKEVGFEFIDPLTEHDCISGDIKETQMIKQYRKKPVVIEAVQVTAPTLEEVEAFVGGDLEIRDGVVTIATLEGAMTASPDDYIIKGVKGEFYPCKPDIFDATYEEVDTTRAIVNELPKPTWFDRLQDERAELLNKIAKLNVYPNKDAYMTIQLHNMIAYCAILDIRINIEKEK